MILSSAFCTENHSRVFVLYVILIKIPFDEPPGCYQGQQDDFTSVILTRNHYVQLREEGEGGYNMTGINE